ICEHSRHDAAPFHVRLSPRRGLIRCATAGAVYPPHGDGRMREADYSGGPARSYMSTANAGCPEPPEPGRITSRSTCTARESYGGRNATTREDADAGTKPTTAARTCLAADSTPIDVVATIVTPSGSARSRTPPSTFTSSAPAEVHSSTYG